MRLAICARVYTHCVKFAVVLSSSSSTTIAAGFRDFHLGVAQPGKGNLQRLVATPLLCVRISATCAVALQSPERKNLALKVELKLV